MKSNSEIPKDVLDQVGELADWYNEESFRTFEDVIARAILAERERALEEAAQCADQYGQVSSLHNYGPGGLSRDEQATIRTGRFIAEDIRALKETP